VNLEIIKEEPASNARPTPILFVHGMCHAAWCWGEHFLPYFAGHGYMSHALSLRGHGSSEVRERPEMLHSHPSLVVRAGPELADSCPSPPGVTVAESPPGEGQQTPQGV